NQMQVIVIIQTSLQLFRELLGINIGQTRNSVLSHNFTISPNEIYCMSILPHLCRSNLRLDLVPHPEVRHWIGSFIYAGGMKLTLHGHFCFSVSTDEGIFVIDPGPASNLAILASADAVLLTHSHPDHVDAETVKASGLPVWGPADAVGLIGEGTV